MVGDVSRRVRKVVAALGPDDESLARVARAVVGIALRHPEDVPSLRAEIARVAPRMPERAAGYLRCLLDVLAELSRG